MKKYYFISPKFFFRFICQTIFYHGQVKIKNFLGYKVKNILEIYFNERLCFAKRILSLSLKIKQIMFSKFVVLHPELLHNLARIDFSTKTQLNLNKRERVREKTVNIIEGLQVSQFGIINLFERNDHKINLKLKKKLNDQKSFFFVSCYTLLIN
ncbi:hypothetical protein BpHYR1_038803 [Brachionus plicatilis]|uniref:Uncharacterized protein n=1 Tax=Brachionus plicatilis TaxID=10195 RepID=A0A3M7QB28_BRAPC|nr:hypothetical protein BpHYR1_038803 [Brachionus plicatilis]